MLSRHLLRKLALAALTICSPASPMPQPAPQQQKPPPEPSIPRPELSAFLPAGAVFIKELTITFEPEGGPRVVFAYAMQGKTPYDYQWGVRVLERKADSGWVVAYDETGLVTSGGGPLDAINIHKVSSSSGKEGVVIVVKYSGAGTATDWHIVATVGAKFLKLESTPVRDGVLKKRHYEFMGYNGVSVKGDLVIEFVPGYSPRAARCCPDRPPLDLVFKFTGNSIKLDSVKKLPFTSQF